MRASTSGSTADVASSRTSSRGRRTSARASESALALAARQRRAPLAEPGVEAVRQRGHEPVGLGDAQRLPHLGVGDVGAEGDVAADGVVEEERRLRHERDVLGQLAGSEVAQVDAVDQDPAPVGVDQPGQQGGQRALARRGGADDGHGAAGLDGEGDVVEQRSARGRRCSRRAATLEAGTAGRRRAPGGRRTASRPWRRAPRTRVGSRRRCAGTHRAASRSSGSGRRRW